MPFEKINSADFTGHDSELSFFSLFAPVSEPVFIIDTEGVILDANNAFRSRFCKNLSECLGSNYYGLLLPEVAEQRLGIIKEVIRSRISFSWDDEWEGRVLRNTVFPSKTSQGEINQLLIIAQDISDIRQLVTKEKAFSKSVIEAIPGAFYVIDVRGKFTAWNHYIRDHIVGKLDSEMAECIGIECIYPEDRPMMAENIMKIINSGEEQTVESRVLLHGSPKSETLLMTGNRLLIDGNPYLIGVGIDITGRKLAEEKLKNQLQHLRSLREIDLAIRGTTDVYLSLKTILEFTLSELKIDAADFFVFDPNLNALKYITGRGFRSDIERGDLLMTHDSVLKVLLEQKVLHVPNLPHEGDELFSASFIKNEGFVDYFAIPLIVKGNVTGLFEIFQRQPLELLPDWLDFLHTLAGQAAMAIEDYQLFRGLHRANQDLSMAYDATIEGWSRALDLRDNETEGHSFRVTEMTLKLARFAEMADSELVHVRRGALLHDIGKMGVPDSILFKRDTLTDEELVVMRQHTAFAFELLSPIDYLRPALDIPYCHHEKWDGSGYPRGLKGEQIPFAARLFAVVDVWDALRSDRPYRKGWTKGDVIEYIKLHAGTHFDPKVVTLFLKMMNEDGVSQNEK